VDSSLSSIAIVALMLAVALGVLLVLVLLRLRSLADRAGDGADLRVRLESLSAQNERLERELRADLAQARSENAQAASAARGELAANITHFTQALQTQLATSAGVQNERLATLTQSNDQRLEAVRASVEQRLEALRSDNAQKLEQMRATVDERLQTTLEQRLGESFKLVSDRLDQVHQGLGEMQTLAAGVGDLKRVLVNVKSRGGWGEVQLGTLLDEMLAPGQYARNVATRPGEDSRVEYAIRFPRRDGERALCWVPIGDYLPLDHYKSLQEAN